MPALLPPELSGREHERPLGELDVHRIGLARLAELLAGLDRPPQWWGRLYAALDPLVVDRIAVEELGALPVPLADGRTVTGPRTTVTSRDAGYFREVRRGFRCIGPGWFTPPPSTRC